MRAETGEIPTNLADLAESDEPSSKGSEES
jgi:hypothetical protein